MAKKKILMCEDDERVVESFKFLAENYGYGFCSLVKQKDRINLNGSIDYILNNLENKIKEENPNYVIIDGLDGKCFKVAERVREIKPEIISIIYSNDEFIILKAKEECYESFFKENHKGLFDFLKEKN